MSDTDDYGDYESGPFCRHWGTPGDCDECTRGSDEYQKLRDSLVWALTYGSFECALDNPLHAGELDKARKLIAHDPEQP